MISGCSKCGAGWVSLACRREVLVSGHRVDVVLCLICGQRIAERDVVRVPTVREVLPVEDEPEEFRGSRLVCAVVGCNLRRYAATGKDMCSMHGKKLAKWERGRRITPPPLLLIDGQWVDNPARIRRAARRLRRSA